MTFRRLSKAWTAARRAAAGAGDMVPVITEDLAFGEGAEPVPRPAWALLYIGGAQGLDQALLEHLQFCESGRYRCLVISDQIPAQCISGGLLFDFAPNPLRIGQAATGGFPDALDYCFRRLGLIFDHWPVVGCHCYGSGAAELLQSAPPEAHPLLRFVAPKLIASKVEVYR